MGIDSKTKTVRGVLYRNAADKKEQTNITLRISKNVSGGTLSLSDDVKGIMIAIPIDEVKEYIAIR